MRGCKKKHPHVQRASLASKDVCVLANCGSLECRRPTSFAQGAGSLSMADCPLLFEVVHLCGHKVIH